LVGGGGGVAKERYYRGVRGSAALATRPLHVDAPAPEALEPGEMRRLPFAGELVGAVRIRAAYAPIPLDAFDRASALLEAEEQAAYLHLLRLSYGEGRNFCRLAKRELGDRVRLSERRLLRVLAALVEKGFARPLHRDNRGTLWRVYLPREAAGEPLGDDVLAGRAAKLRLAPAPAEEKGVARPAPSPRPSPPPVAGARGSVCAVPSEGSLARALAEARGRTDPEGYAAALREVRELLAEGQPLPRIAACIETVRRRAERAGPTRAEGQPDEAAPERGGARGGASSAKAERVSPRQEGGNA
jgi:hypothetical protein